MIIFAVREEKSMQTRQYKWLRGQGWTPDLPTTEAGSNNIVLAFGARQCLQEGTLVHDLRKHFAGSTMVGCSTSGEIAGDEVTDDSLVATVIGFDHTRVRTAHTTIGEGRSSYEVGKELAQQLNEDALRHVFVISDGLKVNGSELAKGIASAVAPGVSITGGLSGDGANFAETWVIDENAAGPHRVAAIGFSGDRLRVGYGSMGGWEPFGPVREITRAEGNVLYELDGRNALDLYKTYLGPHADQLPGSALLFPILATEANATTGVVRTVLSVDEQSKSMTFAGDIPQGGTAQLMKTNVDDLVDGAREAAETSLKGLGDKKPDLCILVSCVGRKLVLKQRIEEEVEAVREVFGDDTAIAGFYSYGELSPFSQGEPCRLHNQTMTITALTEI
jgi:hypothetical protein